MCRRFPSTIHTLPEVGEQPERGGGAARRIARLALVVSFLYFSGTLAGAVCGIVCSSLVELVVCRAYVRPRLFGRGAYRARQLCGYALPLAASALCVSLYQRLDLLLLKALGATPAEAGFYAIAQNLSLLPGLLSLSLAPALLSTLIRALRVGEDGGAREAARQAMRAVLLLAPVAAISAGNSLTTSCQVCTSFAPALLIR